MNNLQFHNLMQNNENGQKCNYIAFYKSNNVELFLVT